MRNIANAAGGGGGSKEWDVLNQNNIEMTNKFMQSPATQVNCGRQIGVRMVEMLE